MRVGAVDSLVALTLVVVPASHIHSIRFIRYLSALRTRNGVPVCLGRNRCCLGDDFDSLFCGLARILLIYIEDSEKYTYILPKLHSPLSSGLSTVGTLPVGRELLDGYSLCKFDWEKL